MWSGGVWTYLFTLSDFCLLCSQFINQKIFLNCQCCKFHLQSINQAVLLFSDITGSLLLQNPRFCKRNSANGAGVDVGDGKNPACSFTTALAEQEVTVLKDLPSVPEVSRTWAKTPREKKSGKWRSAKFTIWHQPSSMFASVRVVPYSLNCVLF